MGCAVILLYPEEYLHKKPVKNYIYCNLLNNLLNKFLKDFIQSVFQQNKGKHNLYEKLEIRTLVAGLTL